MIDDLLTTSGHRVLDVGVGTGIASEQLAQTSLRSPPRHVRRLALLWNRLRPPVRHGWTSPTTYPHDLTYARDPWLDYCFTLPKRLTLAPEDAVELRTRLADRIGSDGVAVGGDALLVIATPR